MKVGEKMGTNSGDPSCGFRWDMMNPDRPTVEEQIAAYARQEEEERWKILYEISGNLAQI